VPSGRGLRQDARRVPTPWLARGCLSVPGAANPRVGTMENQERGATGSAGAETGTVPGAVRGGQRLRGSNGRGRLPVRWGRPAPAVPPSRAFRARRGDRGSSGSPGGRAARTARGRARRCCQRTAREGIPCGGRRCASACRSGSAWRRTDQGTGGGAWRRGAHGTAYCGRGSEDGSARAVLDRWCLVVLFTRREADRRCPTPTVRRSSPPRSRRRPPGHRPLCPSARAQRVEPPQ